MVFDFLEEFAAVYDHLKDKKYFKCESCGFLMEKPKKAETKDLDNCPECSDNIWIETDSMEEGKI